MYDMEILDAESYSMLTGFPFFLPQNSWLSPGFVQVKKAILQVILRIIFAPKGRCQRCSKITGVKNLEKFVSI